MPEPRRCSGLDRGTRAVNESWDKRYQRQDFLIKRQVVRGNSGMVALAPPYEPKVMSFPREAHFQVTEKGWIVDLTDEQIRELLTLYKEG